MLKSSQEGKRLSYKNRLLSQFITTLAKADLELEPLRQVLYSVSTPAHLLDLIKPVSIEFITTTDISVFLALSDSPSEHLAYLVLKSYDSDRDGKLKLPDFIDMLRPNVPSVQANKWLSDTELCELLRQLLKGELVLEEACESLRKSMESDMSFKASRAFEFLTNANSSHILKEHFSAAFSMTSSEAASALRRLDKDKDERVSFKEFERALKPTAPKIKIQAAASVSILRTPSPSISKRNIGHSNSVHFDEAVISTEKKTKTFRKRSYRLKTKLNELKTKSTAPSPTMNSEFISNSYTSKRIKKKPESLLSNASESTVQSDSSKNSPIPLSSFESRLALYGEKLTPLRATPNLRTQASTYSFTIDYLVKEIVHKAQELERIRIILLTDPSWNYAAMFTAFDIRNKGFISVLDLLRECTSNEVDISLADAEAVVTHLTSQLSFNLQPQHFRALVSPFNQKALRSGSRRRQDLNSTLDSQLIPNACNIVKLFADLLGTASRLKSAFNSFKRFSLSMCYVSVSSLVSKEFFLKIMSSLGIYSNVDAKLRLANRKHFRAISNLS